MLTRERRKRVTGIYSLRWDRALSSILIISTWQVIPVITSRWITSMILNLTQDLLLRLFDMTRHINGQSVTIRYESLTVFMRKSLPAHLLILLCILFLTTLS